MPTRYSNQEEEKLLLFRSLFSKYYPSLLVYACKLLNDKAVAEDIIQDIFLSLWINKEYIDFELSLQSYLFRSVYNRSVTYLSSRKHISSLGNEDNVTLNLHQEVIQWDQQDLLLVEELRKEIFHFVEKLPDKCKSVFKLSRLKDLKNKDIALRLGISEKTVESHMRKALKEIREHLIRIGLLMAFLPILTVSLALFILFIEEVLIG